jgi:DUF1365 family protein
METITPKLLRATVAHERHTPKRNAFSYSVFYITYPIVGDANSVVHPALFSLDRFNILSMHSRDHGPKNGDAWYPWITQQFAEYDVACKSTDRISLIAHPRLFGFAFNPISFWLLEDEESKLKAVLCEVKNTFGDSHNYLLRPLAIDVGARIGSMDILTTKKNLYVSPFNTMNGHYTFRFEYTPTHFKTNIDYYVDDTLTLATFMGGTFSPLSSRAILLSVLVYPLMTLMVVYRIHYQAFRLWQKGVRHTLRHRPSHTTGGTTTSDVDGNSENLHSK